MDWRRSSARAAGADKQILGIWNQLPLVSNCLTDDRYCVQKAVGWVLREMSEVYPEEIRSFLIGHIGIVSASAFTRAIERRSRAERDELRSVRKRERSS